MLIERFKNLNNEELMKLYSESNYKAFEELYKRFHGRIYAYFYSKLKSKELAKDLEQDFFKALHVARGKYHENWKVEPWFFTIAHNLFVSFIRRKSGISNGSLGNIQLVKEGKHQELDLLLLEEAISMLPGEQKEVVLQRYFKDKNYEQISQEIGKTVVNTRKILSRAIKKMRVWFKA